MAQIKKQKPYFVGLKPRKIKWQRSKDDNKMPYAYCEYEISRSCDFWVLCEIMWLQGNTFSFYIDSPGYSSSEIKVRGFENALKSAENRILSQIRKSHRELQKWI